MQSCLVTILLSCFLVVYGCSSPSVPNETGGDAAASNPVSTQGASSLSGTPQDATDAGGGALEVRMAAPVAETGAADSTTAEKSAEPVNEAQPGETEPPGETVAGTPVADAKPVNASATDTDPVSTVSKAQAALLRPALATDAAPDLFKVRFTTTKGDFVMEVHRHWAPNGADRLYNLVKIGFFTDVAFFRVMKNFVVQFGIHGEPEISAAWLEATIEDDKVVESNTRGAVSFADRRSANTRTTQLFINLAGMNSYLDEDGYAPVGKVIEGMEVVDSFYSGYGDGAPRGSGPNQAAIQSQGNGYLKRDFPDLDYIKSAEILE